MKEAAAAKTFCKGWERSPEDDVRPDGRLFTYVPCKQSWFLIHLVWRVHIEQGWTKLENRTITTSLRVVQFRRTGQNLISDSLIAPPGGLNTQFPVALQMRRSDHFYYSPPPVILYFLLSDKFRRTAVTPLLPWARDVLEIGSHDCPPHPLPPTTGCVEADAALLTPLIFKAISWIKVLCFFFF